MFGKSDSKINCVSIEGKLVAYLDGRARPADRHAVEAHLGACHACRTRAEEFRALSIALDGLPEISPSASFDAALRARIAAEPERRSFWNFMPSLRPAFAVTALMIMSVWVSSVSRVPMNPAIANPAGASAQASADAYFGMIRDLPVLENYDVVSKFDALSELPDPSASASREMTTETR
jgi:anti-sigma factor RsiW